MLETIAKGFLIGLLVSSPMGPINMLTIQRTLDRGRWHGFVTGLGAMLSDLTYALITLVGMNFVADFITEQERWFQVLAGVILLIFGFGVFRSNPLKDWKPDVLPDETRYWRDFGSSFLLTFSNAAIILVFVGLYARFSYNPLAGGTRFFVAGMVAFIMAALGWWFFLTTFVSHLRKRFNRRGLVILNRTIGSILMLIGVGGLLIAFFPDLI
jgi:threonine/homoserine/homoserine lactone efflux protein